MDNKNDDVIAECSDEEELQQTGIFFQNLWVPRPEEIEVLFSQIKDKKYPDLEWKCPGRRDPNKPEKVKVEVEAPIQTNQKDNETDDFDFEDEAPPTSMIKLPKSTGGSKQPATKKRTTTLAGILSNMERHRNIERMDNPKSNEKSGSSNS